MRVRIFFSSLVLLLLSVLFVNAQTGGPGAPCDQTAGGTDPDLNCPLDTWVVGLAIVTVIFAAWHIRNKQKKQLAPAVQK